MSPSQCYNDGGSAFIEAVTSTSKNMSSVVSLSASSSSANFKGARLNVDVSGNSYVNANSNANVNGIAKANGYVNDSTEQYASQSFTIHEDDDEDSFKGKAKGVSVHHLKTTFAEEVKSYHKNQTWARRFLKPIFSFGNDDILQKSKIYDLENTLEEKNGFIRLKGADVTCSRDNRVGAAYVDCVQGEDNVGEANVMISSTWKNTVREIIDVLDQFTTEI
jgi:hypothetical protein